MSCPLYTAISRSLQNCRFYPKQAWQECILSFNFVIFIIHLLVVFILFFRFFKFSTSKNTFSMKKSFNYCFQKMTFLSIFLGSGLGPAAHPK